MTWVPRPDFVGRLDAVVNRLGWLWLAGLVGVVAGLVWAVAR